MLSEARPPPALRGKEEELGCVRSAPSRLEAPLSGPQSPPLRVWCRSRGEGCRRAPLPGAATALPQAPEGHRPTGWQRHYREEAGACSPRLSRRDTPSVTSGPQDTEPQAWTPERAPVTPAGAPDSQHLLHLRPLFPGPVCPAGRGVRPAPAWPLCTLCSQEHLLITMTAGTVPEQSSCCCAGGQRGHRWCGTACTAPPAPRRQCEPRDRGPEGSRKPGVSLPS